MRRWSMTSTVRTRVSLPKLRCAGGRGAVVLPRGCLRRGGGLGSSRSSFWRLLRGRLPRRRLPGRESSPLSSSRGPSSPGPPRRGPSPRLCAPVLSSGAAAGRGDSLAGLRGRQRRLGLGELPAGAWRARSRAPRARRRPPCARPPRPRSRVARLVRLLATALRRALGLLRGGNGALVLAGRVRLDRHGHLVRSAGHRQLGLGLLQLASLLLHTLGQQRGVLRHLGSSRRSGRAVPAGRAHQSPRRSVAYGVRMEADERRRPAPGGDAGLVLDLPADLRRPGRPDRGHAAQARRREALDRPAALPARPELLHAAARPGGPAARDLHRLAAQRHPRRADRGRPVRAAGRCSPSWSCRRSTSPSGTPASSRPLRRPRPGGHRHRGPGRGTGSAGARSPAAPSSSSRSRRSSRSPCSPCRSRS